MNNSDLKICFRCGQEKKINLFSKSSRHKCGVNSICKECFKVAYQKRDHEEIKRKRQEYEKKNKDKIKERKRLYHINNRERLLKRCHNYYHSHLEQYKIGRQKNKQKRLVYLKNKRNTDFNYRLIISVRNRIYKALKYKKSTKSIELLGCSIDFYKQYLESKFKSGMSWENYGKNGWHIDHIIPCASFDLTKEEEQRKCFHYSNTQPLWAIENISKNDRIIDKDFKLIL